MEETTDQILDRFRTITVALSDLLQSVGWEVAGLKSQLEEKERRIDALETELSTLRVQAGVRE